MKTPSSRGATHECRQMLGAAWHSPQISLIAPSVPLFFIVVLAPVYASILPSASELGTGLPICKVSHRGEILGANQTRLWRFPGNHGSTIAVWAPRGLSAAAGPYRAGRSGPRARAPPDGGSRAIRVTVPFCNPIPRVKLQPPLSSFVQLLCSI